MSILTVPHSDLLTDALNVAEQAKLHGLELVLLIEVHFAKVLERCPAPLAAALGDDMKCTTEMAIFINKW